MANFIPFKVYILSVLDELLLKYDISSPFLDIGCGRGDVALHMAKQGWSGRAIDIYPNAVEASQQLLKSYPQVQVSLGNIGQPLSDNFNLVLLLDVLEHIHNDKEALEAIAEMELPGAYLVMTVPSNPGKEWRWDDDVYGHLRRYNPHEIEQLLKSCGYRIIEMFDISYPIFWFLRRAYTAIKKPPKITGDPFERTQQSPFNDAWDLGLISDLLSNPYIWKPAFKIQKRFRDRLDKGHELAILAQRI